MTAAATRAAHDAIVKVAVVALEAAYEQAAIEIGAQVTGSTVRLRRLASDLRDLTVGEGVRHEGVLHDTLELLDAEIVKLEAIATFEPPPVPAPIAKAAPPSYGPVVVPNGDDIGTLRCAFCKGGRLGRRRERGHVCRKRPGGKTCGGPLSEFEPRVHDGARARNAARSEPDDERAPKGARAGG